MPTSDPSLGIFKRRLEIDIPAGERERVARELAFRGLLAIEERTFVRCMNPLDKDQRFLRDRHCDGRIYLDPRLDESNQDYRCGHCNRVVFPSKKHAFRSMRLVPQDDAIVAVIEGQIRAAGFHDAQERPRGLFRIASDTGQAEVCIVDRCTYAPVFMDRYPTPLVFVVVDDGFVRRIDGRSDVFRFADLALGDAGQRFQRRLREIVRGNADAAALPVVLGMPAPLVPSRPAAPASPVIAALAPPGTRWLDVEFFYIDDNNDALAYRVPGARATRITFKDFPAPGMADSRGSSRTKQWDLLVALCLGRGRLPWTGTPKQRAAFKERVSQLRKSLQAGFGINGNPLKLSSHGGLSAAFQAYPHAPSDRPPEDALERKYRS